MRKQTARNNEMLKAWKKNIYKKSLYTFLIELVNEGKDGEAKLLFDFDNIMGYIEHCYKNEDYENAKRHLYDAGKHLSKCSFSNGVVFCEAWLNNYDIKLRNK